MDSNINENVVVYDWLSFTSKKHTPQELIEALGLSDCPWTEVTGARGYRRRLYFDHISVHYDGLEDMGVWVEMSGQGCRAFESLSSLNNKWEELFGFIHSNSLHITRLDVAYDDHTGVLDIDTIAEDTRSQRYISPCTEFLYEVLDLFSSSLSAVLQEPVFAFLAGVPLALAVLVLVGAVVRGAKRM